MTNPTYGEPHDDSSSIERGVAWDISPGIRLRFGQRDVEYPRMSELVVTASSTGEGGYTKKDVTAEQVEDFAHRLLSIAAAHREATR